MSTVLAVSSLPAANETEKGPWYIPDMTLTLCTPLAHLALPLGHLALPLPILLLLLTVCSAQLEPGVTIRAPDGPSRSDRMPVLTFLSELKTKKMDLVILMERTKAVGRWGFNRRARKLVSHVLRYYTKVGPNQVRLVVATFAADFTVHMNGMAQTLYKCDIWKKYWDEVVLNDTPGVWNVTGVRGAYEKVLDMFRAHRKVGNKRYLWILTSGDYQTRTSDPLIPMRELVNKEDVIIVSTKVGLIRGLDGQIRQLVNSPEHHGGNVTDWIHTLTKVGQISAKPTKTTIIDSISLPLMIGISVGTGVFFVVCVAVCIACCCRWKKRRRHVQTTTMSTYTNPARLDPLPTRHTTTSCTTTGTSEWDNGEYTEIPNVPTGMPPRPTAVIRPSVDNAPRMIRRKGPPTPAKPRKRNSMVGSMLAWVPAPFWSASGREEITMPAHIVNQDGEDIQEQKAIYENSGCTPSMARWNDYLIQLTTTGGLKQFAIVGYDRKAYATTSTASFLPTYTELAELYRVLSSTLTNVISLNGNNYRVARNDGRMLEAFLVGRSPDVLCIGRSKQFLTIGLKKDPHNSGECYKEVQWVRDSLSKQLK